MVWQRPDRKGLNPWHFRVVWYIEVHVQVLSLAGRQPPFMPLGPGGPLVPVMPLGPGRPVIPLEPGGPGKPFSPLSPLGPGGPAGPRSPFTFLELLGMAAIFSANFCSTTTSTAFSSSSPTSMVELLLLLLTLDELCLFVV